LKTKTLLLLFLLLFLGKGFLLGVIPLTDPSEGRYASIALTMAQSGEYLMPRIWKNGKLVPFMGKPALGFWLMAASIDVFGANEFAVRLPGFLAGVLLLGLKLFVLRQYHSKELAWLSLLIAGSTTNSYLLSGAVLVDAVLALFAIGAVFWYYAFLREKRRRRKKLYSLLVFAFLGLGFMTKGPVSLVYFGVPVFFWTLFNHQWQTLRDHAWFLGIPLFLLIGAPWFILAERSHPGFLNYFFLHENFMRFYAKEYGDLYGAGRKLPYGTALLLSAVCFLPWPAIAGRLAWKRRNESRVSPWKGIVHIWEWLLAGMHDDGTGDALFFVGMVCVTLFWCFAQQLVAYYLIPLAPLFAVWCAQFFHRRKVSVRKIAVWGTAFLVSYSLITVPLSLYLSRARSTEEVVERNRAGHNDDGGGIPRIVFVRRMPFSGYFYAHDLVVPHGKEGVGDSIERGLAQEGSCVLVCRKRYVHRVPDALLPCVRVAFRIGPWVVMAPVSRSGCSLARTSALPVRNPGMPWQ